MLSAWSDSLVLPRFKKLNQNLKTDVLIIGGGMAGILLAHTLKSRGINYALVEAKTICSGTTKNTTAKITTQHGLVFDKLIKEFGVEKAKLYYEANNNSLNEYKRICKSIDCDFEIKDSFVYSLKDEKKITQELNALEKINCSATFTKNVLLPFNVDGAIKFENQAQFNPLKFAFEISKGLNIYENTPIVELGVGFAKTNNHTISAKHIVVATHFPFLNKHGNYFLKMYQHRSYVIALENAPNINGMYVDEAEKGMSFRNYKNLLLVGGGDHRTGKQGGGWFELSEFCYRYYPKSKQKYYWATQDCMTLDKVPYIGTYSAKTSNLYVSTGFNKWGMTSSMVSATLLADLIEGKENKFCDVFSPSRTILRPQLLVNGFETFTNFISPTTKRCTHLGCALKWNSQEHSWDCPCHGSRFDESGKIIDNPATKDLKE